jgi:hypothetical protein
VSAEIIRFVPRPNHYHEPIDFPTIAFRSATRPDDLTMDHVDALPCEYVWPDQCDPASWPRSSIVGVVHLRLNVCDQIVRRLASCEAALVSDVGNGRGDVSRDFTDPR